MIITFVYVISSNIPPRSLTLLQNIDAGKQNTKIKCLSVISSYLPLPTRRTDSAETEDRVTTALPPPQPGYQIDEDTRTPAQVVCAHAEHDDARVRAASLDTLVCCTVGLFF